VSECRPLALSRHSNRICECPLYFRKRTSPKATRMSDLCKKQTFKLLFDVIDWVPGREPKLRMAKGRAVG